MLSALRAGELAGSWKEFGGVLGMINYVFAVSRIAAVVNTQTAVRYDRDLREEVRARTERGESVDPALRFGRIDEARLSRIAKKREQEFQATKDQNRHRKRQRSPSP